MFARGLVSLHAPPLLGRKSFEAKSRVSISSKLIEIKGLQLHYFGHLRKTGGRGSYRLVHTAYPRLRKPHGTKSRHSRTYEPLSRKSNYSRTYAIPRGGGSGHTTFRGKPAHPGTSCGTQRTRLRPCGYAQGKRRPLQNRRRRPEAAPTKRAGHGLRSAGPSAGLRTGRSACATRHGSPVTGHFLPLSVTSRQYCAPIARDVAKTEAGGIPAWSGSPRRGYVPFEHRCPDAHD
jgi:hypothetical protein